MGTSVKVIVHGVAVGVTATAVFVGGTGVAVYAGGVFVGGAGGAVPPPVAVQGLMRRV